MRFFMLLILFGCFSTLISSRPTGEGNESENGDADDEGLEYSEEEEDPSEEQESSRNEAVNQDEITDQDKLSQESKFLIPDKYQNKVGYRTFPDSELDAKREQGQDKLNNLNLLREKSYREMDRPSTYNEESNNAEETKEDLISRRDNHQRIESRNVNAGPIIAPDYSNDVLFKNNPENMKSDGTDNINENLRQDEQSNTIKQYYKRMHPENKNIMERRKYDYSCNTRDRERRQVQTSESGQKDENVNDNNENAILKNIKKLSDKDLEELLDSLPEDKKTLLKKIMEKREITKKAGAVDDNNGIDQSDTSKVEESYSEDSNAVLSSNTEASETKQEESEEMTTKTQENENTTGKSESKSGIDPNNNEDTLEVSIEAVTSNIDLKKDGADIISKDTSKNDNKREIHSDTSLEKDLKFDEELAGKNSYDFSIDEMALPTDNTDLYESKYKENKAQKREVPNNLLEPETLSDTMKSLEDSFPNANAYEDSEFEMEPLIRVKRTKLAHRVEKRDLPQVTNDKVPFVPGFENEETEGEGSEFKDKSVFGHSSSYECNDKQIETNEDKVNAQQLIPGNGINPKRYKAEWNKVSLGSDTDNVLSSIEGIDENIMFNNKARNKRIVKGNTDAIIRNGRTIGPGDNDSNSLTNNSLDGNQFETLESFGALQQNTEEELSRSKRVKRDKKELLTVD